MTHPVNDLDTGSWAEVNPSKCPCRGRGWLLSDFDTWHSCPRHGDGVPHPEDEVDRETWDASAHLLQVQRAAFEEYRNLAYAAGWGRFGFTFTEACRLALRAAGVTAPTATQWVDAAECEAEELVMEKVEAEARAMGFSCALEARWADEIARERDEKAFIW